MPECPIGGAHARQGRWACALQYPADSQHRRLTYWPRRHAAQFDASMDFDPTPPWADRVPLGVWTDLSVAIMCGSQVTDHGDFLVVRTANNPQYRWGNYVQAPTDSDDAEGWLAVFREHFPNANHLAIGLADRPRDGAWQAHGFTTQVEDILVNAANLQASSPPADMVVRPFVGDAEWASVVDLFVAENQMTQEFPEEGYREYMNAAAQSRRAVTEAGFGYFVGAWAGTDLVAHVGILTCGQTARYQSVLTRADWRRQGVAASLIGVCGQWAAQHGCRRQVILADAGQPAGWLYRALGFSPEQPIMCVEAAQWPSPRP